MRIKPNEVIIMCIMAIVLLLFTITQMLPIQITTPSHNAMELRQKQIARKMQSYRVPTVSIPNHKSSAYDEGYEDGFNDATQEK